MKTTEAAASVASNVATAMKVTHQMAERIFGTTANMPTVYAQSDSPVGRTEDEVMMSTVALLS